MVWRAVCLQCVVVCCCSCVCYDVFVVVVVLRQTIRAVDMFVFDGKTLWGPKIAFGMVRVVLSEIRTEMAGISNNSGAYQLQCAILAVP